MGNIGADVLVAAVLQALAFVFYAGKMDARVSALEKSRDDHDGRILETETGLAEIRGQQKARAHG